MKSKSKVFFNFGRESKSKLVLKFLLITFFQEYYKNYEVSSIHISWEVGRYAPVTAADIYMRYELTRVEDLQSIWQVMYLIRIDLVCMRIPF